MCGVPVRARDTYVAKLLAAGHRVAVCDQLETRDEATRRARKGGRRGDASSSLVARAVTRVVTAGTLTEEELLSPDAHNYVCAVAPPPGGEAGGGERVGLAWLDVSTGTFMTAACDASQVHAHLAAVPPAELLVPRWAAEEASAAGDGGDEPPLDGGLRSVLRGRAIGLESMALTPRDNAEFERRGAGERAARAVAGDRPLPGSDSLNEAEAAAAAAVLQYVAWTQGGRLPVLALASTRSSSRAVAASHVMLDPSTRRALELVRPMSGRRGERCVLDRPAGCCPGAAHTLCPLRRRAVVRC